VMRLHFLTGFIRTVDKINDQMGEIYFQIVWKMTNKPRLSLATLM